MHQRVRHSRLLIILTALVTALTLVMPVGMARAATATVTAVAGQVLHRGSNVVTFTVANTAGSEATYTPTVTGPASFTIVNSAAITVEAESTGEFSVQVNVPNSTDPANFALKADVVSGTDTSTVTATLPLKLEAGQNRTQGLTGLTAINTIPSQAADGGIDKAFDLNEATMFHSPWDGSYGAPNNIDIDLGATVDLASLEYLPRPAGSNGTWNSYEIWAGTDIDALTMVTAGTMANNNAWKSVPLTGEASIIRVRVLSTYGDTLDKFIAAREIRVRQAVADDALPPLPVTLVTPLASEAGLGSDRMFDHDTLTQFHTPYADTQVFPYNIDLALGEDPVDLASFVMVPYIGGGAGAANGRPGDYTLLGGNAADAITEVLGSGTWANDGTPKTVDLSAAAGTFKFLRLAIGTTYGDTTPTAPQFNKYVAISELKVYGTAVPVITDYLTVSMTRTDTAGATVSPGDVLTFDITYTNLTDTALTAFPRSSNLTGVVGETAPNCRYENLAANSSFTCTTATHTVTAADVTAGSFTPTVTFDATAERAGTTILQAGIVASLPAITVEAAPLRPEGTYIALATAGDFGFTCHRIPALTEAVNGDVLASWDGRPGTCADAPQANSIIQRRSTDGGQTWGDVTTVAAGKPTPIAEKYGYSDPSYVVDRETGDIFNFFVKSFDQGFQGSQAGSAVDARNVLHAAVTRSTDNGLTWSVPAVITPEITDSVTWISRFAASGEGIQLNYAPHKGRLVQQFTIKDGSIYKAMSVYSDDHGISWQNGDPVGVGMDENKVVELSDGRLMINSRDSAGSKGRKVTYSSDGGQTYGPVTVDRTLIDPTNNASIIRAYPKAAKGSAKAKVLLFSNAASTGSRSNGTVRVSFDDGQTWSGSRVFEPGAMQYSTLTPLTQEGVYGLFYEGANTQMRYMTISMEWLGVLPVSITAEAQTVNRGANEVTFSATNLAETAVTFTPTFTLPGGWTASAVAPVTLAAGASVSFTTTVTVPATADPGVASLLVTATVDGKSATGTAALTMALKPGQNPTKAITVTPVNTPPAQSGEGIARAFDGDLATLWHTPYDTAVTMPVDVDMSLGEAPVDVALLEYVPRTSGANGSINGYEVWGGDSIAGLVKVAEGNFASSNSAKMVPLDGSYQFLRLRALSSYGDTPNQWVSAAEIRVRVAVPDTASSQLPLILENELASQGDFPPSNMFDGDTATWFHSPWATAVTFPYNIDLSVGENGAAMDKFVLTPKSGGTAGGDNNGRPLTWKIFVGDSVDDLTEVTSGTWADDNAAKTVPLDGVEGKIVRLQILTTAGDTMTVPANPQNNKYVAIAELEVFGTALPPVQKYLTVGLARTDVLGTPVKVGDKLTFTISYTNTSNRAVTAFPRSSNLDDTLTTGNPNCRWGTLAAGASAVCTTANHTVTAADLATGSFTPTVTFDATADRDGEQVLQAGIVATLPAIEVKAVVDPTPTPTALPTVTVTAPAVTATSSATQTATSSATATTTSTSTATATSSTTATVTSSATVTSTATQTATSTETATTTATATATTTVTATATATAPPVTAPPVTAPAVTVTATPSVKPSVTPTQRPVNVYTDPGYHTVNGRQWFTKCEPYSATTRCFTSIWASQVQTVNGKQQMVTGWVFNNLTYLPMARETWKGNKLAFTNEWTATDGRKWRTECDTAVTGRNGCRSYTWSTVYEATSPGANTFRAVNKWVFNNIVMFT